MSETPDTEKESEEYEDGKIYDIDIDKLEPDPDQPRKYMDPEALDELRHSIEQQGVLQPIIFCKKGDKLYVIAGGRRFEAAKKAREKIIQAKYKKGSPMEIALIENIVRENLKAVEEAEAIAKLKAEINKTDSDVSILLGKKRTTITQMISISRLPKEIRDECRNSKDYSRRELIKIAALSTENAQFEAFNKYKKRIEKSKKKGKNKEKIIRNSKVQTTCSIIDKLIMRLNTMHNNIKRDDKDILKNKLQEISDAARSFTGDIKSSPPEDNPEE